ncbi:hypothetical protein ED733_004555 [Metarhizium rileyi]|uniref:LPXTG-domain-containing protein n=1 Tax=Metarhizium rileyi (strain RCEF 4871) TaxID=1649241 RepID=A0A5C6GAU7_METRR|nr:hypothetical protein ED733_004555 [Metarhizium rileyi]
MVLPAIILLLLAGDRLTAALEVTPGSRCATECLDSPGGNEFNASDSTTTVEDISCRDLDYSTTDTGIKFRRCLDCLQLSKKVDKTESDLKWYIYNLRYTLSTCLYASPKAAKNGTVAAQCNIDRACKNLKGPLTQPGFNANPNTTWDYCTANNGAFMGASLPPCISCLQATEGEVYLSNFMTALEAGCEQAPEDGKILGISGSVFTTSPINMTDPSAKGQENQSSGNLPPSAIAGIAIGVFLIFALAVALLTVHFRRERTFNEWEQSRYYHSFAPPAVDPAYGMSQAYRRYYTGNAFSEKTQPAIPNSSGEYYDRLEAELAAAARQNKQVNPAPQSHTSSTPTVHNQETLAASNASRARSFGHITPARTPSPPPETHTHRRSNTPDSFAVQAYLNAAEDSARLAARTSMYPAGHVMESQTEKSSARHHLPKLRMPKFCNPVKIFTGGWGSKEVRGVDISPPLMTYDPRFHNVPVYRPMTMSRDRVPPPLMNFHRHNGYIEVPLRSGKSTLYGY